MTMVAGAGSGTAGRRRFAIRQYRMPAKVMHWATAALIVCMFCSGVIAKQLGEGALAGLLFSLHKLTGVLVLALVVVRIVYRVLRPLRQAGAVRRSRTALHWTLYVAVVAVPLLGWAGVSDFGSREVFAGLWLPAIWPEGAGYDGLLLQAHAYLAFGLIALVIAHIGLAIEDYMTGERGEADPK